jgi:hypothetical protein
LSYVKETVYSTTRFVLSEFSGSGGSALKHLALQLLLWEMSESMGNHDSEVMDASSVD